MVLPTRFKTTSLKNRRSQAGITLLVVMGVALIVLGVFLVASTKSGLVPGIFMGAVGFWLVKIPSAEDGPDDVLALKEIVGEAVEQPHVPDASAPLVQEQDAVSATFSFFGKVIAGFVMLVLGLAGLGLSLCGALGVFYGALGGPFLIGLGILGLIVGAGAFGLANLIGNRAFGRTPSKETPVSSDGPVDSPQENPAPSVRRSGFSRRHR